MNAGYDSEEENIPAIDTDGALSFDKKDLNFNQQQMVDNRQNDQHINNQYIDLGATL